MAHIQLPHRHRTHPPMFERRVHALVVGIVLLAMAMVIGALLATTDRPGPFAGIDERWLAWMVDIRTPWLTSVGKVLSKVGGPLVTAPLRILVVAVLAYRRRWLQLGAFVGATVCAELCIGPVKALVDRPRPGGGIIGSSGSSFPSGHAVAGAVTAFGLVLILLRPSPRRLVWIGLATAFAGLMAVSRTYLGVHWLSDVVAGTCIGTGWVLVWAAGLELLRERSWRSRPPSPVRQAASVP